MYLYIYICSLSVSAFIRIHIYMYIHTHTHTYTRSMRAALGEMELDEILHARAKLNAFIKATLQESALSWGLEIKRYGCVYNSCLIW
ncbi:hypothetical protein EON63_16910 [archaeon]|nr:MAG: hypothetical protein EON63_16910 [archaeon]